LFVVILVVFGLLSLLVVQLWPEQLWGLLFLAAAAAVLVSCAVIEPATAQAAFGQGPRAQGSAPRDQA
jgi:hypothetical protein